MHLYTSRPPAALIQWFLNDQAARPHSYAQVRLTQGAESVSLPGFRTDHYRAQLGAGAAVFAAAQAAVRRWEMFHFDWLHLCWPEAPIVQGTTVGVLAQAYGVWFLNACRIVYVVDEPRRFGFAYGTLPGHAERGEERFMVEHRPDDSVWYEVLAVSRPQWWVWPGYPLARRLQRAFGRETVRAMRVAVGSEK